MYFILSPGETLPSSSYSLHNTHICVGAKQNSRGPAAGNVEMEDDKMEICSETMARVLDGVRSEDQPEVGR